MACLRVLLVLGATLMTTAVPAVASATRGMPSVHRTSTRAAAVSPRVSAPLEAAAAVARRYWGATPCGGQVTLIGRQPLGAGVDRATDAWVTFDSALGANDLTAPATTYTQCTIAFAQWRWPTTASMQDDWDLLCLTMVHEMGHLLGHVHDATPGSVMAPLFTDLSSEPALCRSNTPRRG